jgi:hypothetical protein
MLRISEIPTKLQHEDPRMAQQDDPRLVALTPRQPRLALRLALRIPRLEPVVLPLGNELLQPGQEVEHGVLQLAARLVGGVDDGLDLKAGAEGVGERVAEPLREVCAHGSTK